MNFNRLFFVALIAISGIAAAFTIADYSKMKSKTLLIFPKGSSYAKEWKKVDSLTGKGLNKSALEVVNGIYEKAKTENNAPQFVKAIIHRMKFEQYIEEYSLVKSLNKLTEEAKGASYPVKPVLQSMIAESYWQYYQNNRWKFYNRTETVNFNNDDITTWDLKTIFSQVVKNYQASLESSDSLKRTPLNIYDEVLIKQPNSRNFRPTLYDFLAHRAVDFYMNEEPDITRPAYKFELNSESYFWNFNDFAKIKIESKDTLSSKFYAVKILQEIIAFHSHDENPRALIDADLKRLKFVKNKSVSEIKDSLYLTSLQNLENHFTSDPASADVGCEIAKVYFDRGNKYAPLQSEEHKWQKKQALEVCEAVIKKFPKSDGAVNCEVVKAQIKEHAVNFVTEKVTLPNQPFRALLTYKNLKTVYVRIAQMDIDKYKKSVERYYGEPLIKEYLKLNPVKEFSVELPDDGDFQSHTAEIKIPELPFGHYIILMGSEKGISYKKNGVAYAAAWVSNISYINRRMTNGSYDFYVQHRETGAPLKGVSAQLYYEKYNYTTRKYEFVKSEKYTTDENGYFNVPPVNEYRNFTIDFAYKAPDTEVSDWLQTENAIYQYRTYPERKERVPKTFFFMDRGIYRPGQTVYFKGIMINTDGETNEIMPNTSTTVIFYDVNSQKVAEANLKTNEYGTFNGTFTTPSGALNGQMSLNNGSGSIYFSVEEYKRPKFDVTFNPVKGSYRLNENIKVEGLAKAYSGAKIDGAEVKYRVVRNASFPYWWYWQRGYYPQSPQMEITNGVTVSNDTGAFFVNFKAIPDLSIPKSYEPTYSYTIYADVTDINGETHSSQTYVRAAYTALNLDVNIPALLEKENKDGFVISTTNMSGQFEPAQGKIEIYKLNEPDKTYRTRPWSRPDKFLMSKEEFEKTFPNDEYKEENNMYKWQRGEKIFEKNFKNTGEIISAAGVTTAPHKNDSVKILNLKSWKPGVYVLEAHSKDAYGEDVKDIKYITVYSNSGSEVPGNEISWFNMLTVNPIEPGNKAQFVIGTKENNVEVLYEIEHKGIIVKKEYITLNKEQKLIEIPVEEKHRGNFSFHCIFIKNNRTYLHDGAVYVPYTNKELDIEFETFRNKLLPGQQEEWKVKIKDKKGDKVAAEMVAAMYDASLDAFRPNNWYFDIYQSYYSNLYWDVNSGFGTVNAQLYADSWNVYPTGAYRYYDQLNWFNYNSGYYGYGGYLADEESGAAPGRMRAMAKSAPAMAVAGNEQEPEEKNAEGKDGDKSKKRETVSKSDSFAETQDVTTVANGTSALIPAATLGVKKPDQDMSKVAARSNFAETAFFFPALETDKDGNVIIKFTIPEALTKWKMMGFAHTKDLKFGSIQKELVTQKELMVIPNAPRFFRENDKMEFSTKISNLSDGDLTGTAQIFFYDASSMKDITSQLLGSNSPSPLERDGVRSFTSKKGQSSALGWSIAIPEGIGAITYKVVAKSGNFSDGEEMALPVLTNRMLVTETMPLPIRGHQTKTFRFEKFINQNNASTTLRNHKLTLEFTANPAWYAVQALPYIMEYPYECSEQTFARFYANSIASHIANSSPKIKAVFDSWKSKSPDALLSNLEKNQDLKSLMLEETPWVLDAKDESERKKRVGLLFDFNKMSYELTHAMKKLQKQQSSNGGWPWFEGMPDDRYITQYIITGMGHLDHLGIKNVHDDASVWKMVTDGVKYLDNRIREDYEWILKYDKIHLDDNHLSYQQIQYLYARSYFKDISIDGHNQKAFDYYKGQAKKYWLKNDRYMQGMIALALNRYDDKATPKDIMKSIKENSLNSEEMGMYWKENYEGYYWYQAPIEAQALLIEAFDEVSNDKKSVDDLKVWLLKSKQTQDWKTTKATSEAIYALLLKGTDWLATESNVEISMGDVKIDPRKMPDVKVEAGTGYFKTSWSGGDIKPKMGEVTVVKNDEGVSWGAVYWQYFEQLDKITPSKTPLNLKKHLFLQKNTDSGPVIEPITEKTLLKVGDKIKVRIELRVDFDMEYVQMKDMRASGFEPTNVISRYKWQDGLGYYESTRDAATNFFFSYLPKGTYVFEYPLVVTHNGDFSNGITSIQCMYAPEFASNSEGIRVKVGK